MRKYWLPNGICEYCKETLWFDTESGEPIPHVCPEENYDYPEDDWREDR